MLSELLPVKGSPDNILALNTMEMVNSDNRLAHVINLVAYPLIVALSALYNTVALAIKLPFTLFRHTFGYIPTSHGRVMDSLPKDTELKHFLWHAYKILMSPIQLAIFYPFSVIMPGTNVFFQRSLCLIDGNIVPPLTPTREDDDLPPPPPPRDEDPKPQPQVNAGSNQPVIDPKEIAKALNKLKKKDN